MFNWQKLLLRCVLSLWIVGDTISFCYVFMKEGHLSLDLCKISGKTYFLRFRMFSTLMVSLEKAKVKSWEC